MLWKGFQKPKRLEVDREDQTDTFGRFTAQPFERGFATTVGNALRRVLLSSIEGAAITAVRVEGVRNVLRVGWRMARPARVNVKFGAPLTLRGEDYAALAREVEEAVKRL